MKWLALGFLLFEALPQEVVITTWDQQLLRGELLTLQGEKAVLMTSQGEISRSLDDVGLIEIVSPRYGSKTEDALWWVYGADGTQLRARFVAQSDRRWVIEHPAWGELSAAESWLRALRFIELSPPLEESWQELVSKSHNEDRLIVKKGDVLDHLSGTLGRFDGHTVQFLLEGEELELRCDRLAGIIRARASGQFSRGCLASFSSGESLMVQQVAYNDGVWSFRGSWGSVQSEQPPLRLDFSPGRVVYLSDLDPVDVQYTPFWDSTFEYQRDRGLFGGPLRVGDRTYSKGLAVHSRTLLRYRLSEHFRRFQAVVGIDPEVRFDRRKLEFVPTVALAIRTPQQTLWQGTLRAGQDPVFLDLPLRAVSELILLVDFSDQSDIGDRLHLGNARLLR